MLFLCPERDVFANFGEHLHITLCRRIAIMWHHSTMLSTSHLYNSIYQWKGSVSTKAAFALQLVALAIGDHLALVLAKLAQRLDVNAVFSESAVADACRNDTCPEPG